MLKDFIVHLKNDIRKKDKIIESLLLQGKQSHYEVDLSSSLSYEEI